MKRLYLFALSSLLLLVSSQVLAAGFIKFDGVDGESKAAGYESQSDVLAYDWGMSIPTRPSGATRRRAAAELEDLIITKTFDSASVRLQDALASGFVFREAVLTLVANNNDDGGRTPYLVYKLGNVRVVSYQVSWSDKGSPVENIGVEFENIELSYTVLADDNSEGDTFEWNYDARSGR